jgi:two-component system, chemotaxis family, CheB/CheR fusion protein
VTIIVKKKTEDMGKIEKSKGKHLHTTEETLVNNLHDSGADSNKSPKQNFPIVGICASAGGLAEFKVFFTVLPTPPIWA